MVWMGCALGLGLLILGIGLLVLWARELDKEKPKRRPLEHDLYTDEDTEDEEPVPLIDLLKKKR